MKQTIYFNKQWNHSSLIFNNSWPITFKLSYVHKKNSLKSNEWTFPTTTNSKNFLALNTSTLWSYHLFEMQIKEAFMILWNNKAHKMNITNEFKSLQDSPRRVARYVDRYRVPEPAAICAVCFYLIFFMLNFFVGIIVNPALINVYDV